MNTLMRNGKGNLPATNFSGMIDNIFQNNLSRFFNDDWDIAKSQRPARVPVNVRETDTSYEVALVAPGLKKDNFKINLNGNVLTVGFEQEQQNDEQNDKDGWIRKEYAMRSFQHSFELDETVDANKIEAKYNDGILYLTVPKKEGAKKISRTINVQ